MKWFLDGAKKKYLECRERLHSEKSLTETHQSEALTFWAAYHFLGYEMMLPIH